MKIIIHNRSFGFELPACRYCSGAGSSRRCVLLSPQARLTRSLLWKICRGWYHWTLLCVNYFPVLGTGYLTFTGHEALELYSVVTNTTSQWVCQSESPVVVYTDLCCINPVSPFVLQLQWYRKELMMYRMPLWLYARCQFLMECWEPESEVERCKVYSIFEHE
jgi:hypothetical protein